MSDFIKIPIENVIREGQTVTSGYCDKKYVIYFNKKGKGKKARINTYFLVENNMIELCKYYDRGLCDTIEDYHKLDIDYIERQAYGSWMDGAR